MAHTDRKARRARKKAEKNLRNAEKSAARQRGRDSGAFSETGFTAGDAKPSLIKQARIAATGVFQAPKKAAVRESLRRAAGGKVPSQFDIAKGGIEGAAIIGLAGPSKTLFGSIIRAGKVAGPGLLVAGARKSAGATTAAALGAGAGVLLERELARRGQQMAHRGAGQPRGLLPGVGGALPSKDTVVKVWTTGTANFARLLDGRIAVQRKDGTIKTYRPQKHIVIPRNPRVGTLIRADKRLERLTKGLRKVVRTGKR